MARGTVWETSAEERGKRIQTFDAPPSIEQMAHADKATPIFIDLNLSHGMRGDEVARTFFERGFREIFLMTGADLDRVGGLAWVKQAFSSKTPPWESGRFDPAKV